jgi:hypothetical protein
MNPLKRVAAFKVNKASGDKDAEISHIFSCSSQNSRELAVHYGIIIAKLSPLFRRDASIL